MLKACRGNPGKTILASLALVVLSALVFADALIAGPMRTWVEQKLNSELDGYSVQLARVRPHIWRLAFDLDDLVLVQVAHPDPPVGRIAALRFSVAMGELLRFKLVGDLVIERPAMHVNLVQLAEEANSAVNLQDRGWQKAVESIFPIKLDRVQVQDGSLLYLPSGVAGKPVQLTSVYMSARNVRNVAVLKGTYPSPVTLQAVVFDTGKLSFNGVADFLREPHAAGQGEIRLEQVPLDRLDPIAQEYQVRTRGGVLSVAGSVEYSPEALTAHLTDVLFEDLQLDYVTTTATKAIEEERLRRALEVASSVRSAPTLFLRVDTLMLKGAQLGFVNEASKPPYRMFMEGVELKLENLDNHSAHGRSRFHALGAFMGSGQTVFSGGFLASAKPADFDVRLKVDDARLADLNPLLLPLTGVDVAQGRLSVYSELTVKNGRVEGYIKPLFKNLKISEHQKDKGKPFVKRVEMHLLQFLVFVFKNHTTKEVATVIRISGSTVDPKIDEWAVIRRLLENGFAGAVLPGFRDRSTAADAPPAVASPAKAPEEKKLSPGAPAAPAPAPAAPVPAPAPASRLPKPPALPVPASRASAPRPSAPPASRVDATPPLDLKGLEQRLKSTRAIGMFTKLALKNQVDDLLAGFRTYHGGQQPPTLTDLRPNYELLIMKVQSLIQKDDPALASDVASSREAIWGVLADKNKFALI